MVKVTASLISLLAALAHTSPVTSFSIHPFLNRTNSTNTTYHKPQLPDPSSFSIHPFLNRTNSTNTTYHKPQLPDPSSSSAAQISLNTGVETIPSGPSFYRGGYRFEDELCSASSFTSVTRATSALTSDCLLLADDAVEERHLWYAKGFTDNNTILQIRNHGTCSFGIRPPYADAMPKIITGWYVGGMDVAEIVRTAVRDFDVEGLTGASGMMHCWISDAANVDVQWAIYGPGEQAEAGWWLAPPVPSSAEQKSPVGTAMLSAVAVSWLFFFW